MTTNQPLEIKILATFVVALRSDLSVQQTASKITQIHWQDMVTKLKGQ